MIPTSTLVPIVAIIFTTIGFLLLLGIPKVKYGKIIGALSLIASIVQFAYFIAFQMRWEIRDVPIQQESRSEASRINAIKQTPEANPATKKLLAQLGSFNDANVSKLIKLIKDGADVNAVKIVKKRLIGDFRYTILHIASRDGHAKIVKVLLDAGADVNPVDEDNETPIFKASKYGHTKVAKMLIKAGADMSIRDEFGKSPLWIAANQGRVEMVRFLIAAKADIRLASINNTTPLHAACSHPKIVKMLLAAGAEVNTDDDNDISLGNGITPLMAAAIGSYTETVKLLIKAKANVNAVSENGHTPLSLAVESRIKQNIKALIDAGADVNKGPKGNFPLMCASKKGDAEIVRLLIAAKADINTTDDKKATPLHVASSDGHTEIVKMLLAASAELGTTEKYVNTVNENKTTALMLAVEEENIEVVKLLLKAKADVNVVNEDRETAMKYAKREGNREIIEILKAHGAKR